MGCVGLGRAMTAAAAMVGAARGADVAVAPGQSVQAAIDAAPAGTTIRLAPGAYPERLVVAKPLAIEGAGWDRTTVGLERMDPPTPERALEFARGVESAPDPRAALGLVAGWAGSPLVVRDARGVSVRGLRLRGPGYDPGRPHLEQEALVIADRAGLTIIDCAVVGPFQGGILALDGSDVAVERSLVAAIWGTGVVAEPGSKLRLAGSDVRNCYYAGVTLKTDAAAIERCRVAGAAWHGLRYDDCSPRVVGNQLVGNALCGIYASGRTAATVRGNVFRRNEAEGMRCLFGVADVVEGNTFVGNRRAGVAAIGGATPALRRNVFVANPVGVRVAAIPPGDRLPAGAPAGDPAIEANVFFDTPTGWEVGGAARPLPLGNRAEDPGLGAEAEGSRLGPDSPARAAGAGAADPAPAASPFPVQPEEAAMIPDGDSREARLWKGRPKF